MMRILKEEVLLPHSVHGFQFHYFNYFKYFGANSLIFPHLGIDDYPEKRILRCRLLGGVFTGHTNHIERLDAVGNVEPKTRLSLHFGVS